VLPKFATSGGAYCTKREEGRKKGKKERVSQLLLWNSLQSAKTSKGREKKKKKREVIFALHLLVHPDTANQRALGQGARGEGKKGKKKDGKRPSASLLGRQLPYSGEESSQERISRKGEGREGGGGRKKKKKKGDGPKCELNLA